MKGQKFDTRCWKAGQEERPIIKQNCKDCGRPMRYEWILKGWAWCPQCNKKHIGDLMEKENTDFFREIVGGLRNTVSHSRKGQSHKQPFGFHIETPYVSVKKKTVLN